MSQLGRTPLRVKVLILTTYEYLTLGDAQSSGEALRWYTQDRLTSFTPIPGTYGGGFDGQTPDGSYEGVFHNEAGDQCLVVAGMGQNNACSTLMALGTSEAIDLSEAYLLVAGIAGGNPNHIGLGSVAWANWAVAGDLANLVALSELPQGAFLYPLFHLGCSTPWPTQASANQGYRTGTEVFALNQDLARAAHTLSARASLAHPSGPIRRYAAHYHQPAAVALPAVLRGDSISSNNFYHGRVLGEWAEWWLRQWTEQWRKDHPGSPQAPGVYSTSLMEDVGFATAAQRLDRMGRLRFDRLMLLRGVGNFDRPSAGQATIDSLQESDAVEVAFNLALDNLYAAGSTVVQDILASWDDWKDGPPARLLKARQEEA